MIIDKKFKVSKDWEKYFPKLLTLTQGRLPTYLFYEVDETIKIKPGFRVVATMNLFVGGSVFPLPEALVDRAAAIREFEISPETVAELAI